MGINAVIEDRIGGDIKYIEGEGDAVHSYFEKNNSNRFSTQLSFEHDLNEQNRLTAVSYTHLDVYKRQGLTTRPPRT